MKQFPDLIRTLSFSAFRVEEKCDRPVIIWKLRNFYASIPHSIQDMVISKRVKRCNHDNINMAQLQIFRTGSK